MQVTLVQMGALINLHAAASLGPMPEDGPSYSHGPGGGILSKDTTLNLAEGRKHQRDSEACCMANGHGMMQAWTLPTKAHQDCQPRLRLEILSLVASLCQAADCSAKPLPEKRDIVQALLRRLVQRLTFTVFLP